MPLPVFFIGAAAAVATGAIGGEKTIKAAVDSNKAEKINKIANISVEDARVELDRQRKETATSIEKLGALKLDVLTEAAELIETRVIDGQEFFLIPVTEDVTVNGIRIRRKREGQ